jgi:hypothetical protein
MIVFDLQCGKGHVFEAWFKDGATFERQHKRGLVSCAICGSTKTKKSMMAPRIGSGKSQAEPSAPVETPAEAPAEHPVALANAPAALRAAALMKELAELRRKVETSCDNVGDKFAEEARKMHYGEAKKRSIYGDATEKEAEELHEEGIEVGRIPWVPRTDS